MQSALAAIAISKIHMDCCSYGCLHATTAADYIKNQLTYKGTESSSGLLQGADYLENYVTARIDIANRATDANDIEFVEISDHATVINSPKWFSKSGKGYVLESHHGYLHLVLKCIGSGDLEIILRSRDVKDYQGNRIPFWLDYKTLRINDKDCLNSTQYVWHNNPYKVTHKVNDGDIVDIIVEWSPHDERLHSLSVASQAQTENPEAVISQLRSDISSRNAEISELQKRHQPAYNQS